MLTSYVSIALSWALYAQVGPHLPATDAPIAILDEPPDYQPPGVASPNNKVLQYAVATDFKEFPVRGSEPIHIKSFVVRIKDVQLDVTPRLLYEVIPFFDTIAIKIVNIGWGPFNGGTFDLMNSASLTPNRDYDLRTLLDIDPSPRQIPHFPNSVVLPYRLGPNCTPFSVAGAEPYDIRDLLSPPRARVAPDPFDWIDYTGAIVTHPINADADSEYKYSGLASFEGKQSTLAGQESPAPLLLRFLSPIPGRRNDDPLLGALMTRWALVFGNRRAQIVGAAAPSGEAGVEIDLRDFTQREFYCDVDVTLPAGRASLGVKYLASRSATFTVELWPRIRVGNSPVLANADEPLIVSKDLYVYAPREMVLDLSYGGSRVFMDELRAADSGIDGRARVCLQQLESMEVERFRDYVDSIHTSRQCAHAIMLCMSQSTQDSMALASRVMTKIGKSYRGERSWSINCFSTGINELFALLCKYEPESAVRHAIDVLRKLGDVRPLRHCYMIAESRDAMFALRAETRSTLLDRQRDWMGDDLVLAAYCGLPEAEERLFQAFRAGWPNNYAFADCGFRPGRRIVGAAVLLRSQRLDQQLESALDGQVGIGIERDTIVSGITEEREGYRFVKAVERACRQAQAAEDAAMICACLEYFIKFRTSRKLCVELTKYSPSHEVRKLAKAALRVVR